MKASEMIEILAQSIRDVGDCHVFVEFNSRWSGLDYYAVTNVKSTSVRYWNENNRVILKTSKK